MRTVSAFLLCCSLALPALGAEPAAVKAEQKAEQLEEKAASVPDAKPAAPGQAITQGEVQAVDPAGQAPLDDPITCMARSIYWEAKGGSSQDMQNVAMVVMNRLGQPAFADTVCGVVKQGSEKKGCQFSWWCDGRPDQVQEDDRYRAAKEIARQALNRQLPDRTGDALFFHDRSVHPAGFAKLRRTTRAGLFVFYKAP